jgi:hypothetical protein
MNDFNDLVGIPLAITLGLVNNNPEARQSVIQLFSTIDQTTTEKVDFYSRCSELGTMLVNVRQAE